MDKVTAAEELIDKTLNEVISNEANQNVDDSERAGNEDGKSYLDLSIKTFVTFFLFKNVKYV